MPDVTAQTEPPFHGYDVARFWEGGTGFSLRRLVRRDGVVPIPENLPGYRVALSLRHNEASLAIGRRITTAGSFAPGTCVLGQPGDVFDGEMRGEVDVFLFLMDPLFVAAELDRRGYPGGVAELRDRPASLDPGLLNAGCRLADVFEQGFAGSELYCEILIDALVTRLITRHVSLNEGRPPYTETLPPAKLKRLVAFVDHNLATPLRLADLAVVAALSRAHLARAFRNAMGVPLHRYVLYRRLERARYLLEREGISVQAAAYRSGFADAAHLSKAFRRAFGKPPSAIRPLLLGSGFGID